MKRPPVELDERKAIPKAWKEAARARSGGVCAYPDCEISKGLEYDHILALKLSGKHRLDNIQALCHGHHLQKTALDVKMIARAKRRSGETGQQARRERRGAGSIQSKGFPARNRKLNGTVGLTQRAAREANDSTPNKQREA